MGDPKALVRWLCPTAGVERFQIRLAPLHPPTNTGPSVFRGTRALPSGVFSVVFATNVVTEIIGGKIGSGPKFAAEVGVIPGEGYAVEVMALSAGGVPSENCRKARLFKWTGPPPEAVPPQVPWPERGLPPVTTWPGVHAQLMGQTNGAPGYDASYPVGIRIGLIDYAVSNLVCKGPLRLAAAEANNHAEAVLLPEDTGSLESSAPCLPSAGTNQTVLPIVDNPANYLFAASPLSSDRLFPVVMYRTQVTNDLFPVVSGDIIQASPLLEKIAYWRKSPMPSRETPSSFAIPSFELSRDLPAAGLCWGSSAVHRKRNKER
jgi:hypothetical protein